MEVIESVVVLSSMEKSLNVAQEESFEVVGNEEN